MLVCLVAAKCWQPTHFRTPEANRIRPTSRLFCGEGEQSGFGTFAIPPQPDDIVRRSLRNVFFGSSTSKRSSPSSDEHHHLLKWAPSFLSLNHTLLRKKSLLRKKYARIYQLQSKGHVVFSGKNRNKWSWRSNQYWTTLSYQTSQLVSCWEPGEATYANFVALSPECDWTLIINDPILYPGTL